ncbi:MAG: right-handed parallel beta-helix repeat-containing protein [Candidatus Heimdallarchaeaceae archaeon]
MRRPIIPLFIILLLSLSLSYSSMISQQETLEKQSISSTSDTFVKKLISSDPILIYNDGQLVAYGLPGNGTKEDPYRIENLSIFNTRHYGILISGAKHYFVIQNCGVVGAWSVGISIQNTFSGYGNISNNAVEGYETQGDGINLQNCKGITVSGNTVTENVNGISIKDSSNCSIVNNRCNRNLNAGIHVEADSSDCFFENNRIQSNNEFGLLFSQSGGSLVYNNTLLDNSLVINENTLDAYLNYEIIGNTFDGKKIEYLKNLNNIVFNDTSCRNLFLINCTKILVEDLNIRDNSIGVFSYESNNCTYQNNLIRYNTEIGLNLINSNFTNIISNTFSSNSRGFVFSNSYHILVLNNSFNWEGIHFQEIERDILDTMILENNTIDGLKLGFFYKEQFITISESEYGQLVLVNCSNIAISNLTLEHLENTITVVDSIGLVIENCSIKFSEGGITIDSSQNVIIQDCNLKYNNYGIQIFECSKTAISNVTFLENLAFGIDVRGSNETTISSCNIYSSRTGLYLKSNADISISNSVVANCRDYNLILNDIRNCYLTHLDINNSEYGIFIKESNLCYIAYSNVTYATFDGIYMLDSNRINVMWSNISLNTYGINSKGSSYGVYKYNTFFQNRLHAISFYVNSAHNVIHHNVFNDNRVTDETGRLSQAWDDGYNNTFYDVSTYVGNWWSNIKGSTYYIAGSAGSVDVFPLNPFIITHINTHTEESSSAEIVILVTFVPVIFTIIQRRKRRILNM